MSNDDGNPQSTSEVVRKGRFIRRIPLFAQVIKQQLCSEGELIRALTLETYGDGEYIYSQGQSERDLLLIEEGKVLITRRRRSPALNTVRALVGTISTDNQASVVFSRRATQRRSQIEADMEIQLQKYEELEYFGEETLLQGMPSRVLNAVASGSVTCFVLPEAAFARLLAPVHDLMLCRHLLRMHDVVSKQRVFQHFSARQRQYLLDRCTIEHYEDTAKIIQQGDKDDDRYFLLTEGEVDVVLDEPLRDIDRPLTEGNDFGFVDEDEDGGVRTSVVARKTLYQGFGEMGILGRPRVAHVVAVGAVLCVVITRKLYVGASQLLGVGGVDADAEALLAMSLAEEWALVVKTRNLHLANPLVSRHLEMFVKKFKAAFMQKFEGKTLYLDLLRRMNAEPALADEFPFVADRVAWDAPTSSLSIVRAETRRVLSLPTAERLPPEITFLARLLEPTNFIGKFDRPDHMDSLTLARGISKFATFFTIQKDKFLFRQGKIESRAFLILRGNISIVNEDVHSNQAGLAVKNYDVLATLSAGDSFGELSLVTRLHRSATALAACEADLLVLERAHLQALSALHPGVSVQQAMVERAEFLATLSFFRDSDFAQCIRVAHDLQEQIYEPRHIFLQEPMQLRTLYIVKRGEVAVFLRRQVPIAEGMVTGILDPTATKEVLVRVATIGPQEFFGVAIASANMTTTTATSTITPTTGATASPSNANAGPPSPSPPPASTSPAQSSPTKAQHYVAATFAAATAGSAPVVSGITNNDLSNTVFMCSTRVQMLELSERGWRRLAVTNLQSARNSLLERHRWHVETVERQHQQGNASYFLLDKPWQLVTRPNTSTTPSATGTDCKEAQSRILEPLPATQLARRLKDKKQQRHQQQGQHEAITRLFSPVPQIQSKLREQCVSPTTTDHHTSPNSPRLQESAVAWGTPRLSPRVSSPLPCASQLSGSFQPNGVIATMPAQQTPVLGCGRATALTLISPRPPTLTSPPTSSPSPRYRDSTGYRRMSTDAKQNTIRTPQAAQGESDYQAMWKLHRRHSKTKS